MKRRAPQLDRVEALDGELKSYATVMADSAMAQARAAEAEISGGTYRGPLHGVPIAVKDLCFTTGVRTMGGTRVMADFVPDFDATVVSRFEAAGAVLLGKLNLTEGAMAGYNPDRGVPVESLERRCMVRRLLQRLGRRRGRGPVLRLPRQRHGRFHPVPLRLLRRGRHQAPPGAG